MGGILIALQAIASYRRAKAMEDAAKAQAAGAQAQAAGAKAQAAANQNTERGQRQERLKNAIEHLGHSSDSVRLGGAYELFHLAEDNRELNQTILDILCAHIRQTTSEEKYQHDYPSKPSEEIQSLLTLLFVREHEVFSGCYINLQDSWLKGANLLHARLVNADLFSVDLGGACLIGAKMQTIKLIAAKLIRTDLDHAQMQGADIGGANLTDACLSNTKMQGVDLMDANLTDAYLSNTKMQAARFYNAQIQNSHFDNTQIQGAIFGKASYVVDFEFTIKNSMNKKDDFNTLHFDDITDKERILKGVVRGHYTEEEAEKWIAEYNEATALFTKK